MQLSQLHPSLPEWMTALEARLASLFVEEDALLREASRTAVGEQGKRLRPAMLLLACACFGEVTARAITNGCLVELVHTASLVHDDVIDDAETRRGAPAAHMRWGNKFTILLGDYLLARVFELASAEHDFDLLRLLAPATTAMGRGVIQEISRLTPDADEAVYWDVVHGKTASLFGAALAIGALRGGADTRQQLILSQVGECFGYAFQLADDLLDLQGAEAQTGKTPQSDWRQRRATLPLLYTLSRVSPSVAETIHGLWDQEPFLDEHFRQLAAHVARAGGFEYGWSKVKEYLSQACCGLQEIPDSPGRTVLVRLCSDGFPLPVLPIVAVENISTP